MPSEAEVHAYINGKIDEFAVKNMEALQAFYGAENVADLIFWAKKSDCKMDPLGCPRCHILMFMRGELPNNNRFQRYAC